jgi:hypothetical protein
MISNVDIILAFNSNQNFTLSVDRSVDLSKLMLPLRSGDVSILSYEYSLITKKIIIYTIIQSSCFLTMILKDENKINKEDIFIISDLIKIKKYLQGKRVGKIGYRIKELAKNYPELFYV